MNSEILSLQQSRILIAGGTSGVGLATAHAFIKAGAQRIALMGRNPERGEAARKELEEAAPSAEILFLQADAGDAQSATRACEEMAGAWGGIDVMICSVAASYVPALLFRTEVSDLAGILMGQAYPAILMSRLVLPYMREQQSGVIINIASDAAKVPTPGESVIGAGMAAIVTFSRTLAMEAKRDGIRVNAMTPSLIANTPVYDRIMSDPFSAKLFANAAKLASLGVAEPKDIADMIVFLASPSGAKITGQAISVNGGISAA